jgi:phosphate:Na+ symporter
MTEKIAKYEEITDRVEVEIAQFLEKLASGEMSSNNSIEVRSMLSITNDLERIGDIFFQMSKTFESKTEKKVYFDPKQRESLNEMLDLIDRSFEIMNENLNSEYGKIDVKQANDVEEELQTLRDDLKKAYLKKVEKGDQNIRGSIIYNEVFSHIAKIGDHIVNISQAVGGKV